MHNITAKIHYRIDLPSLAGKDVKCNLGCKYCHKDFFPVRFNEKGNPTCSFTDILRILESVYSEDNRERKIHFSGRAEPLVLNSDVLEKELSEINKAFPGFEKVMTTNAYLLKGKSDILSANGIKRLNVSVHNDSFKSKKYISGIKSAVNSGLKICLNAIIVNDNKIRLNEIMKFALEYNLSVKFFIILGINKTETMNLLGFCDSVLTGSAINKHFVKDKNRFVYKINDSVRASLKIPLENRFRPEACKICPLKDKCLEGCRDSIRITPWYIKPCGIRNDNIYFYGENNTEILKQKLKSGGKL